MLLITQETIIKEINTKHQTSLLNIIRLLLMCMLFLFIQVEAEAQVNGLSKGDRVKVTIKGKSHERYIGYVVEQSSFAILLRHNKTNMSLPLNSIESIYVKRGDKRRTGLGIGIGLVSGGIIGALHTKKPNYEEDLFAGLDNFVKVSGGAVIGSLTGALIGSMFKTKRWLPIPITHPLTNRHKTTHNSIIIPSLNFKIPISGRY